MPFFGLVPGLTRPILVFALLTAGAGAAWQVQSWRYERQLADQARLHLQTLNQLAQLSVSGQQKQRDQRHALEQRLYSSDKTHQRALNDAKQSQTRLRDRLATADVRLSVLLAQPSTCFPASVPSTTAPSSMVYGAQRAELDPAHAQRIIGIAAEGDEGLIALAGCQGYVREIQKAVE